METQILASWVTASAAAAAVVVATVYTIGTFMLWRTTKRSVETMSDAFKLNFILAYREAGSPGRLPMRVRISEMVGGDPESIKLVRDSRAAERLDQLLKQVFPNEYNSIKVEAKRKKPIPSHPSQTKTPTPNRNSAD